MKKGAALIFLFAVFSFGYSESFFDIFSSTVDRIETVAVEESFSENLVKGEVAVERGDFKKALYHLQKADRIMSGDRDVLLGLARAYRGIGEYQRSIDILNTLYQKYKDENLYYELLLSEEKRYEATKTSWKKAKIKEELFEKFQEYLNKTGYSNSKAIYHMGNIYVKEKSFEKALEVFEKDKSGNLKNLFGAATMSRMLGYYDRAIGNYTKLIDKNRSFYEAYLGRGVAYKLNGNFEKAIGDFETYLDFEKDEELYTAIASMYLSRGLTNSARETLEEGTKYFPNSKEIRELLIVTYSKLGR